MKFRGQERLALMLDTEIMREVREVSGYIYCMIDDVDVDVD